MARLLRLGLLVLCILLILYVSSYVSYRQSHQTKYYRVTPDGVVPLLVLATADATDVPKQEPRTAFW